MAENITIFFFGTCNSKNLKLDIDYLGLKVYKYNINDDPGLTLTNFTAMSNLVEIAHSASDQ